MHQKKSSNRNNTLLNETRYSKMAKRVPLVEHVLASDTTGILLIHYLGKIVTNNRTYYATLLDKVKGKMAGLAKEKMC